MDKVYNCFNCAFLHNYNHKQVECDIKLYNEGKMVKIDRAKAESIKSCPSHSSKDVVDTRFGMANKSIKQAPDACHLCGRRLDLNKEDTYVPNSVGEHGGKKRCIKCDNKI